MSDNSADTKDHRAARFYKQTARITGRECGRKEWLHNDIIIDNTVGCHEQGNLVFGRLKAGTYINKIMHKMLALFDVY